MYHNPVEELPHIGGPCWFPAVNSIRSWNSNLVELDLPLRVRQVGLDQRVHQQPGDALQDELEVLLAMDPGEVVQEQVVRR